MVSCFRRQRAGIWEELVWVLKAKGFIDPCPLWDEDGNAYLSFGCAGSRAGNKSIMFVAPMSQDGMSLLAPGRIVYDGRRYLTKPIVSLPVRAYLLVTL